MALGADWGWRVTAVDPLFAQWLMSAGQWHVAENAGLKATWGDVAVTSERMTTIATKAGAEAEAERQLAFMGGPLVIEEHVLVGEWAAFLGRVINLKIAELGYDHGLDVFVIGVQDDRSDGISRVTVVRRL